jgi:hypothetical protein
VHDGVDGQLDARLIGLGGQEAVVEAGVVRDQCAAAHQLGQIVGDVAEGRLILQHLDGETVDVRGARSTPGLSRLTTECSTRPSTSSARPRR